MASHKARSAYVGDKIKLVIAIDVGTTFSGVSYTLLIPNQVPQVYNVSGFEGQEDNASSTKVPTVLYYNHSSQVVACGCQLIPETELEDEPPIKVEWFKLLLRPSSVPRPLADVPVVQIPQGLTLIDVFGHFLGYMKQCVQDYIQRTHVDGKNIWDSTIGSAIFILTHPNGWEGYQQEQMRTAAIIGELIPDNLEGRGRVTFVTEGEASFHWCVDKGIAGSALKYGSHIIVADAGGGTIDVSSFRVASVRPLKLEEAEVAECRFAGSIFVTKAFGTLAREKLKRSRWDTEDHIEHLLEDFEKKGKCLFRDDLAITSVRLGSVRDNDAKKNIKFGKMSIDGSDIAKVFEDSCRHTAQAIRIHAVGKKDMNVFLVGGFAASPWLYKDVSRRLRDIIPMIYRAESQTAKAVAHGAIVHYLDGSVTARVAKHTYGTDISWHYDASNHLHQRRTIRVDDVTGERLVDDGYISIVKKGDLIPATATFKKTLSMSIPDQKDLLASITIKRYDGKLKDVTFFDMDSASKFKDVCTFSAHIPSSAHQFRYGNHGIYWDVHFDVVINIGTAELQCCVEWKDKSGKQCSGPAASAWEDS